MSEVGNLGVEILSTLCNCTTLLQQDASNCDIVITRLESAISAISGLRLIQEFEWGISIQTQLENIVDVLLGGCELQVCTRSRGRPKIFLPVSKIEYFLSLNFKVTQIASMFKVSQSTVFNILRENNISVRTSYTNISDEDLGLVVLDILKNQPNTGYKRMKGHLLHRNIKVTDQRVREIMRFVDPVGVYQRTIQKNQLIRRRRYFVEYSNQIWHIDGNHKLIRWGIVIRSGIDGKSRTVTYMEATDNNRAESHLKSFLRGVSEFGVPLRTRSDKGGENVDIARFMIEVRGTGRRSHICGRSVHNQRIERHWRDLYYGCVSMYYELFSSLETNGLLLMDNSKHVELLHMIYIPRLNNHIREFVNGWNSHPLSTEQNRTPLQIMIMNLPSPVSDIELREEDLFGAEFFCDGSEDLAQFATDDSITNPVPPTGSLTETELQRLAQIDFNRDSDLFGYDIFEEAVNFIFES